MSLLKVSDFFKNDIPPLLLGAFFSRRVFSRDNKYIFVYTSYRESQKVHAEHIQFDTYNDEYISVLNEHSAPYNHWVTKEEAIQNTTINSNELRGQAFFVLENDLNINKESFYNKLYSKIVSSCDWLFDETLNDDKRSFIRGYMELRGSIDTTAAYIAQDYFYDSLFEIKKARLLVDYLSIPYHVVNINFRELQHQYYSGICTRNTQFRLNIWWYMENIGVLNGYKAEVFALSRNLSLPFSRDGVYFFHNDEHRQNTNNNLLDERLNFYSTKVFSKDISTDDVLKMRTELGFDENRPTNIRNAALVETIRYLTPDECACCKNRYRIEDRSYINRKTGRYYFEIHHVISLGNNKELDDENNMVKLCPACHRALKRGSGTEVEQKELIKEIFSNVPQTLVFAKHFFDTEDLDAVVDMTYKKLN